MLPDRPVLRTLGAATASGRGFAVLRSTLDRSCARSEPEQISRNLGRSFNIETVMLPIGIGLRCAFARAGSGTVNTRLLLNVIRVDVPLRARRGVTTTRC